MSVKYVSDARLRPYSDICDNEKDAIELHGEAMLIGSALLSVIALFEIALRNRVHSQLGKDFGTNDWLVTVPNSVPLAKSELDLRSKAMKQARQDRYSKLTNTEKRNLDAVAYPDGLPAGIKHTTLSKKRQSVITVSEGEIVAHTTLFFWKRFFASEYEPTIWKRSVKKVFPNKQLNRPDVSQHVEVLYRARNRLAHHEPMYGARLEQALVSIKFVRENMDVRIPSADGPLCLFTESQYRQLLGQKAQFDEAWRRLTQR